MVDLSRRAYSLALIPSRLTTRKEGGASHKNLSPCDLWEERVAAGSGRVGSCRTGTVSSLAQLCLAEIAERASFIFPRLQVVKSQRVYTELACTRFLYPLA